MTLTYDMQGREITRGEEATPGIAIAFEHVDFVTIDKIDLENLISLLQEVVDQKEYIDRDDPRCISYERLVDIKIGVSYPVMLAKSAATKTQHFK